MQAVPGQARLACAEMTLPAGPNDSAPVPPDGRTRAGRSGQWFSAARARYENSWIRDVVTQLRALDFVDWTLIFAAELLWSALPFIILLSSLANHRIDDDLSRHIGLNSQGAEIVKGLFRNSPSHSVVPIADGLVNRPERRAAGPVVQTLTTFVVATVFFCWTMHFLLDGRVPWRLFVRPALLTAILWVALGFFSSLYFSSVIIDDSKTYGAIGVVFTFLTWFILIGSVVVLGAAAGAVWQQRTTPSIPRR